MINPADLIPLARVVAQIRILCDERSSGAMFLISEENRMAQVHLSAGQVVAVMCRNKRGVEAIQLMREIHSVHMRFDDSHFAASDSDELLTEVFFSCLAATHQAPARAEVRVQTAPLTSDVKATLQKLLAKRIGPMAEIICLEHFEGATNVLPVIEALASEIPSLEDANKFRADAARAIGER